MALCFQKNEIVFDPLQSSKNELIMNNFHCKYCKKQFFDLNQLQSHIIDTHQRNKPLKNVKKRKKSDDEVNENSDAAFNKKRKLNTHEQLNKETNTIFIEFPPDIPLIIYSKFDNQVIQTSDHSDIQSIDHIDIDEGEDQEQPNFECDVCGKEFFHEINLKKHVLTHEKDKTKKTETTQVNAWKKILDGDPNTAKPLDLRSKKEQVFPKEPKIDTKCTICHTHEALEGGACRYCRNNKLGMPFCTNCDQRLSYDGYQEWLKANDIDKNKSFDSTKYLVLCQTCCACVKEFL